MKPKHIKSICFPNTAFMVFIMFFSTNRVNSQFLPSANTSSTDTVHELTIFVIHSARPLSWHSPSSLYKSYIDEIKATLFRKEKTMLGHMFVRLKTPLLNEPLYAGILSKNKTERAKLLFVKKIGLAVLGAGMKSRLQNRMELESKIDFYAKKKEIAFITYKINEEAASRIIEFYKLFTSRFNERYSQSDFYGGEFWPLYKYEGSGCVGLGMSMLELSNIRSPELENWKQSINLPMELIGGAFNGNRKIRIRDLKRNKSWHSGEGKNGVDYHKYDVYDPSLIFSWITSQINQESTIRNDSYTFCENQMIPGLISNRSNNPVETNAPIITERPNPNAFQKYHYQQVQELQVPERNQRISLPVYNGYKPE